MNFNQGIPLGRWFGTEVSLSWTFFLGVLYFAGGGQDLRWAIFFVFLLFSSVLLHEFGHAFACKAVGGEAKQIVLSFFGGWTTTVPPMNPTANLITTAAGPVVNAVLWLVFWAATNYGVPRLAEFMDPQSMAFQIIGLTCIEMASINKILLLFNLIPAYPLDGGQMLHQLLWYGVGYAKSLTIAGMVGTVAGAAFIILGFGLYSIHIPVIDFELGEEGHINMMLLFIGFIAATQSFGIYQRSQQVQSWRKN